MRTYVAKNKEVKRIIFVADAADRILGRLATKVATVLTGKHKPMYTPNIDTGDYVIVINADKIRVTGKKRTQKIYRRYSGYPGGLKEMGFSTVLERKPKDIVRLAVKNMLPKSKLGRKMLRKLRLYIASEKPNLPKDAKELSLLKGTK